jgi:hypothetical protein
MRSNELVFVQADGLQQLEHLDLDSNNIFRMPKFCDNETGHSLVPKLLLPFERKHHFQSLSNGSCPISEFVDYPDTGKSGIEVSVWHYQLHLKPIILELSYAQFH